MSSPSTVTTPEQVGDLDTVCILGYISVCGLMKPSPEIRTISFHMTVESALLNLNSVITTYYFNSKLKENGSGSNDK